MMYFALQSPNVSSIWDYYAQKSNKASLGLKTGSYWPRGKMLGGCTGNNGMVYVRGNDRDYNKWAEAGNPSWGWDNVLEYFKKSEGIQIAELGTNLKHHNTKGPLKVGSYNNNAPIRDVFINAGRELGYKILNDYNADDKIGITYVHGIIDGFRRSSTAKAFLVPNKDKPNLHVITNAHVIKLILDENKSAKGVEFILKNKKITAFTSKEVILAAGAIGTPQIMMLSGIGPKEHLQQHSIRTLADLPVGFNLQDHVLVPFPLVFNKTKSVNADDKAFLDVLHKYIHNQYTIFGHGMIDILGFFNTINETDKYPDIQMHSIIFQRGERTMLPKFLDEILVYKDDLADSILKANEDADILFILLILLNPKSIGKVSLQSSDPFDYPLIDANYFENIDDVNTFIRGIRIVHKFMETNAFKEQEIEEVKVALPDCALFTYGSDKYYDCYVRHLSTTLYHPVGTAKMGPNNDKSAVVDSRLKVHGIKNLRVCDASIMPDIVSGNTMAPVIMIAEKASDFVKEDWGFKIDSEF